MARRSTSNDDAKTVVLLDPDGQEYRSSSPAEINRLHYGQGYTFRDVPGFTEALDHLGDEAAVMGIVGHSAVSFADGGDVSDGGDASNENPSE